jgi:hypothetical protein
MDDWLPFLKRAATWNEWGESETLLQLAGHLRGRALQEWNLMDGSEKANYDMAVSALQSRLEHRNKTLAAQDFAILPKRTMSK